MAPGLHGRSGAAAILLAASADPVFHARADLLMAVAGPDHIELCEDLLLPTTAKVVARLRGLDANVLGLLPPSVLSVLLMIAANEHVDASESLLPTHAAFRSSAPGLEPALIIAGADGLLMLRWPGDFVRAPQACADEVPREIVDFVQDSTWGKAAVLSEYPDPFRARVQELVRTRRGFTVSELRDLATETAALADKLTTFELAAAVYRRIREPESRETFRGILAVHGLVEACSPPQRTLLGMTAAAILPQLGDGVLTVRLRTDPGVRLLVSPDGRGEVRGRE